jgi:hypothetical protein
MAAIAGVPSRASGIQIDVETLKTIVMSCGAGLNVSVPDILRPGFASGFLSKGILS